MTTTQVSIAGHFSGNDGDNNIYGSTINNYSVPLHSYVPKTFEELIARSGWASPPGIDLDHLHDEHNLPRDNTGKWVFEEIVYKGWRESKESKLLWLCGGPGTGKTMLAKRVAAEFLKGPHYPPEGVKLLFHFVPPEAPTNRKSTKEDWLSQLRLTKVVGGLLYSILQQDRNSFDECKAEFEKQGDGFFTNTSSLWKVLEKAIRGCQTDPVYMIIDGVTGLEGKSPGDLIERVLGLMEIRTVKIFLSSWDVPNISNKLHHNAHEFTRINLDTTHFVKMDVEAFIKRRVNMWKWDVELSERAVETLLEKSEGIFLWASLAIDHLGGLSSGPDFDELLKKTPLGLGEVYQKMLHSLNPKQVSEEVLNMIRSVALALRPLTFSELGHIIAGMKENAREGHRHSHRGTSNKIQPIAEKVVKVYVKSSMGFLRATDTTVSIIHHTAIEYLFSESGNDVLPVFSKSRENHAIAWVCFQYLHYVFGDTDGVPGDYVRRRDNAPPGSSLGRDRQGEELKEASSEIAWKPPQEATVKQTFLRYAAESWLIHARRSIEISEEHFYDQHQNWLQHQFFETSDIVRKPWIELCGDSRMEVLAGEQTPLQIAVCLGLVPLVEKILADIAKGMGSNRSLLRLVVKPNSLVKELVWRRAYSKEINKKNRAGNTPLHLAIEFDYTEIVKSLVKAGANTAIKNNEQMTALELAERLGRRSSVDILKQAPGEMDTRYNTWWFFYMGPDELIGISSQRTKFGRTLHYMAIGSRHSFDTNIISDCGIQVSSYVPTTFERPIWVTHWWALEPEIDLDLICNRHGLLEADSGKWIFEEAEYRAWWESKESKFLWLCGGPGTGKTMLAGRIAAEFHKEHDNPSKRVKFGCHFVSPEPPSDRNSADNTDLSQRSLAKIASDLLHSILQQDSGLLGGCKAEFRIQGKRFFTNQKSLWGVLRKAIRDCKTDPVYILIDGIDGLHESLCKELLGRVLGLMAIGTVKVFLSCRDIPHIRESLLRHTPKYSKINLDMSSSAKEDVETFIRLRVNAKQGDVDVKEGVVETLLERLEGSFLSASLAIDNLTYLTSGPDSHELRKQPRLGLEEVYRTMLCTVISHGGSGEVLNTIWSVALALRPVTFSELGYILACIEGKSRVEQQPSHGMAIREIQPRSEKEVRMYVQSSMGFLLATETTVSIVHHTALEYLFRKYSMGSLPVLSKGEVDLTIAWESFRYLHHVFGDPKELSRGDVRGPRNLPWDSSLEQSNQEEESEKELEDKSEETPWEVARKWPWWAPARWTFLKYAAEFWFIHARRSLEISNDAFCDYSTYNWLQHQFFNASDVIRKPWIKLCGDSRMEALAGEQAPLNIAVCLGLVPLVERALSVATKEVNSDASPLHLAAKFTSRAYKILIARSGPPLLTKQDRNGNTPLHEAVISGHWLMVVGLVEKFATPECKAYCNQINKQNLCGNTPLHLAFQFDHPEIVEFLFNSGADPTIKNCAQMSAPELRERLGRGESWYILKETGYTNTNIKNDHGIQVPSYIPATFEELVRDARWWVSSPEIDLVHLRDEYNLPQADTGEWIFEDDRYRAWQEGRESKLLWLCGGPGIGKTMLAKRVAAECLRAPHDLPERVKVVFYFVPPEPSTKGKSTDEDRLSQFSLAKVAGSLLYSILVQDGNLFDGCKAELGEKGDGFFADPSSLWKILKKVIRDCWTGPVYILIDGVDGLRGRSQSELIGRILGLMEIGTVKIFLSSRDVPQISDNLLSGPRECIKIDLDTNRFITRDVETFIKRTVGAWGWDADLSERAIEVLLEKSEGSFLGVSFALRNLACLSSGPDFAAILEKPLPELENLYRRMLGSLSELEGAKRFLHIIRNVALALRPLTFGEFCHILAWIDEKSGPEWFPQHSPNSQIQTRSVKEIRMHVKSSMGFLRATAETVSIVHHTATEFLFDQCRYNWSLRDVQSKADLETSWECFQYLHYAFGDPGRFQRGSVGDRQNESWGSRVGQDRHEEDQGETPWAEARKDPQEAAAEWPFLRYAAESWLTHARRSIEISIYEYTFCDDSIHNWLQHQFFESSDVIRKPWIELCGDPRMEVLAGEQTPLHIAACLGLMPLVKIALSGSTKRMKSNQSPQSRVAKLMSGVSKALISKGGPSSPMDQDLDRNTPVHEASVSRYSSADILEAPAQNSAPSAAHRSKINKKNGSGNTPLHLAFQFNHMMIVEFLLRNGADPTIKNKAQLTPSELGGDLEIGDNLKDAVKVAV